MSIFELVLIGVSLSMDAFSVSISKGLSIGEYKIKNSIIIGLYFGIFQGLMPAIGYYLGTSFSGIIESFDHWIALLLLVFIGANMIRESFSKEPEENFNTGLNAKVMIPLAIATSIDALAVGVTFAIENANIFLAALIITITTFIFSFIGVKIGNVFGTKYKSKAELFGGVVLIGIGLKIFIEHSFF